MKCGDFKKYLGEYVDEELSVSLKTECDKHIAGCETCRKQYESIKRAWGVAGELPVVEPSPAFVSRFWTRVATQNSGQKTFGFNLNKVFVFRRILPAAAALSVLLVVASVSLHNTKGAPAELSFLGASESEFSENMELAEHLDIISDMDWLEDSEVIDQLDAIQV